MLLYVPMEPLPYGWISALRTDYTMGFLRGRYERKENRAEAFPPGATKLAWSEEEGTLVLRVPKKLISHRASP
jgi:hypothetical protein